MLNETTRTTTLLYVHPPKTGGTTLGALFQPFRRLYSVVSHPQMQGGSTIRYRGGHHSVTTLTRRCNARYQCCVWMMSFREPVARLHSAFATSVEDHQHFDCPRGSRLHRHLRHTGSRPLSLERFTRYPKAERRACGLNVYLDMLAPPSNRRDRIAARLRRAKERVATLPIVVLCEHFHQSLRLLEVVLGLSVRTFAAVFTYNPRDGSERTGGNLSARAHRVLRRDLRPDIELWATARRRFEELYLQHIGGPTFLTTADRTPQPFACAWRDAHCWDKQATQHLATSAATTAAQTQTTTPSASDSWALLRQPAVVMTWPITQVSKTELWLRGEEKGRRQRFLCAAPCHAEDEGASSPQRQSTTTSQVTCSSTASDE